MGLKHNIVAKHWDVEPFTLVSPKNRQASPLCSILFIQKQKKCSRDPH